MALPVTAGGHQDFGVKVKPDARYRIDHANGVATGSQPEGIHMVRSSDYTNQWCCFDCGSGEKLPHRHGQRHHERRPLGQRLLVRRVHRQRSTGRGRPGERDAPHQHGLRQGSRQHRCAPPVRQRAAEEQQVQPEMVTELAPRRTRSNRPGRHAAPAPARHRTAHARDPSRPSHTPQRRTAQEDRMRTRRRRHTDRRPAWARGHTYAMHGDRACRVAPNPAGALIKSGGGPQPAGNGRPHSHRAP